jgi:hypothetical protein
MKTISTFFQATPSFPRTRESLLSRDARSETAIPAFAGMTARRDGGFCGMDNV